MKIWVVCTILFISSTFIGHRFFLTYYSTYRVKETLKAITRGTLAKNQWFYIPKLDQKARMIRRVSSDILYAYCLFDLSEGNVSVGLEPWGQFQSASIFSLSSDHYYSVRSIEGEALNFTITRKDFPAQKGFIMMRRLAHGKSSHRLEDICKKI